MALVKTVEMRVLADAGDAQAKLDELDAKAKELDGNAIKMRFRLDDSDGKAQLDAIRAKADELGFKDVNIKVRVDGKGRAIADLDAIKNEADNASSGGGLLSKLAGLAGSFPGGGALPIPGGVAGLAALPLIAAGLAAAATEATALASGFAAAATGAGAFALLALPAIDQVKKALTDTPAQLKKLKLSPDEAGAVSGIRQFEGSFGKISTAFQPQAFKVFSDALKVANDLLPKITPFASTFATSMDSLLTTADKAARSKGFQQFLGQLHSIEGPALTSIGAGLGGVAVALGRLLTVMSGKDVAHGINIAFGALIGTINTVTGVVRTAMNVWDGLGIAMHNVASTFDTIRHSFAQFGDDVGRDLKSLVGLGPAIFRGLFNAAKSAAHDVASAFDHVRHDIAAKFDSVKGAIESKFAGAGAWLSGKAHDIANAFDHVRHDIAAKFDGIKGNITAKFAGAIGWLVSAGKDIVQGLINGLNAAIPGLSSVIGHITSIVKSVAGALGIKSPSTVFYGYGVNIAEGLALGMQSGAPSVSRAAGRLAGATAISPVSGHGGVSGGGIVVQFHSVVTSPQDARKVVQILRDYKRTGGNTTLGIA